jgi:hypothetical protein
LGNHALNFNNSDFITKGKLTFPSHQPSDKINRQEKEDEDCDYHAKSNKDPFPFHNTSRMDSLQNAKRLHRRDAEDAEEKVLVRRTEGAAKQKLSSPFDKKLITSTLTIRKVRS